MLLIHEVCLGLLLLVAASSVAAAHTSLEFPLALLLLSLNKRRNRHNIGGGGWGWSSSYLQARCIRPLASSLRDQSLMHSLGSIHYWHASMLAHSSNALVWVVLKLACQAHTWRGSFVLHATKIWSYALVAHKILLRDITKLSVMPSKIALWELLFKGGLPVPQASSPAGLFSWPTGNLGRVRGSLSSIKIIWVPM